MYKHNSEKNKKIFDKNQEEYKWLQCLINLDVWKLFLDIGDGYSLKNNAKEIKEYNIFKSLNKIKTKNELSLEDIVDLLDKVNVDRFDLLKEGKLEDEEKKKLNSSLNSKLKRMVNNEEITQTNVNKIKNEFKKLTK